MTRSAADIGVGLADVRPGRRIEPGERIHVVGVGGAGASAAALLAAAAGATVTGCDAGGESPYSTALAAAGIVVVAGHAAAHVTSEPRPDRLAVSKALTAVAPAHPELGAARAAGIPLEPWQQLIADAAVGRRLVAVAGTHGKSTSAGWLTHVLAAAGADPSAFVGALMPRALTGGEPATARIGDGATFVVEADEYAGNFDAYRPSIIVLTSAEWDHPDVFADRAAVLATFEAWIRAAGTEVTLVANVGDPGVAEVAERLADWPGAVVAVGVVETASQRIGSYARGMAGRFGTEAGPAATLLGRIAESAPGGTTIELHGLDELRGPMRIRLPTAGRHNVANALGVAGAARVLGLEPEAIVAGLASFPGIGRRLERKGEAAGVVVYDDYGHHPTAIGATIQALRQREPGRRIWAVYEPLTFHRTAALLGDFAEALATADAVAIADIWAGRDLDTSIVAPSDLAAAVSRLRPDLAPATPGSVEATADWLAAAVRPGDAVLVMGGGRSYRIGERLLARLGSAADA
ncbi:MAG: UDP-N-acetylmuramate--L-alanine ligase [Chloroflexi bacterium]|nr:UDP-N-acetylmuramate--L-alanine ligase [Chloroflexota bacterium]